MSTLYPPKLQRAVPTANVDGDHVPAVGSRRRLRALAALGWPPQQLAAELGLNADGLESWLQRRKTTTVPPELAERIGAVYDHLSMTPGPCPATRATAFDRNWYPPLAWDDDEIDDPTAQACRAPASPTGAGQFIDEIAVERACRGRAANLDLTRQERAEAVRRLAAVGFNDYAIAERLGMTPGSILKLRKRHAIAAAAPAGHPSRWKSVAA